MRRELLVLVVLFTLFVIPASAGAYSNLGLEVEPERDSVCPGSTLNFVVTLINNDDEPHTYSVFLEAPEGWSGLPDPHGGDPPNLEKTLASGEGDSLNVYVTPPISGKPGEYSLKIVVLSGNDKWEHPFTVEVLKCHDVSLEAEETIEMCGEREFEYSFEVTNNGKEAEEFRVTVSGSWEEEDFHDESVTIGPGGTEEIVLNVTSPGEDGEIKVKAESGESYAKDEKHTQVKVINCYDFDISLEPGEASTCLGGSLKFVLTVSNLGTRSDTYEISSPDWVVPEKRSLTVEPGEEGSFTLLAYPELKGKTKFDVTLGSQNRPKLEKTASGTAEGMECRGVTIIALPASQEVCRDLIAKFKVTVKNTGTVPDSYELETDLGFLEKDNVSLEPGKIEEIELVLDTEKLEFGENQITVKARSGDISDRNKVSLLVRNCYSVEFGVHPEESGLCRGDEIEYTLVLKNVGEFADDYSFMLDEEEIGYASLEPDELKMFSTKLKMDYPAGEYNVTFKALSEHISEDSVSRIVVKPEETCYNVELSSGEQEITVEPGKGIALGVKVENTGERADSYVLEIEGPEWVHLSEDMISLEGGEETYVYLYASPGYEVESKTYDLSLKAESSKSGMSIDFSIGAGVTPEPGETTEEPNVTIDAGIPTGAVVGATGNTGKVVLLAAIVLLIIVILAVKFVMFVK